MRKSHLFKCLLASLALCFICTAKVKAAETDTAKATALNATISTSNGGSISNMTDDSYSTRKSFAKGESITLTSSDPIYNIYIKWDTVPDEWTMSCNNQTYTYGKNGFLHEYVSVPGGATSVTITVSTNESINHIAAYSAGSTPDGVQDWKTPFEGNTDILVFATHADDEILFLGGVLATYAGQENRNVQVAYMCDFTSSSKIREHEKLDGLWRSGVKAYPVCGGFADLYSLSLSAAQNQYQYEDIKSYVTECIRRFKPMVAVSQDFKGEYGHGGHMIYAAAISECLLISNDATQYPESATKYGTWDIPKTYFHLYAENQITMNLRVPLSNMNNETAIEVSSAAYKEHVSQQWCWFYVDDQYEYSCAKFGLYRSSVGTDTTANMLENVLTYAEQAEIKRQEQEAAEKASIEAELASEEASIQAEQKAEKKAKNNNVFKTIIIILVVLLLLFIAALVFRYIQVQKMRKRRAAARRRRANKR